MGSDLLTAVSLTSRQFICPWKAFAYNKNRERANVEAGPSLIRSVDTSAFQQDRGRYSKKVHTSPNTARFQHLSHQDRDAS